MLKVSAGRMCCVVVSHPQEKSAPMGVTPRGRGSLSTSGQNYQYLTFTGTGTLTVTKSGLDITQTKPEKRKKMSDFSIHPIQFQGAFHVKSTYGGGRPQRMKARSHMRPNCTESAIVDADSQARRPSMMSLLSRERVTSHKRNAYNRLVTRKLRTPWARGRFSGYGASISALLLSRTYSPVLNRCCMLFNNLMNALTRKVKLISNCAQRLSSSVHLKNLEVSVGIRLRARTQRAPLPIANSLQLGNLFLRQLSLAATLTQVANPRTERQGSAIHVLNVHCWDTAMTLSSNEVVNGCKGE